MSERRESSVYRGLVRNTSTYCRFRHLFTLPIVRAESATAATAPAAAGVHRSEISINPIQIVTRLDVEKHIASEDGATRLKNIFKRDPVGNLHPDLQLVLLGTGQATLVTFLFAFLIGARQGGEFYRYRHQAAKYETKFTAMRAYYDSVLVGGMAHGFRYAVKVGLFTGIFMTSSQCIASFRNKTSPWEYTAAGALTGGVLRIGLGFRGMIAGGVLGSALGLIGGLLVWGAMSAGKERQQDRYFKYIHEMMLEKRRMQTIQAMSKPRDQTKNEPLTS